MENQKKVYCGTGKEFGHYGQIGMTIILSDIPQENIFEISGKKAVKLKVSRMKTPTEKSTHYVEVNTWKPGDTPKKETPPTDNSIDWDTVGSKVNKDLPF